MITKIILNPSEQKKLDEEPLVTCEEIPVDESPLEDGKFDHEVNVIQLFRFSHILSDRSSLHSNSRELFWRYGMAH